MPRRIKRPRRRQKRKGRNSRPGTSKRNPFAALVVTGVRSLVASLPGATLLTPLVDIFFTGIGFTEKASIKTASDATLLSGVAFHGLCGMTALRYTNILVNSPSMSRNFTTEHMPRVVIDTPYYDAKLDMLRITALPDTKIQSRSGRWAMAFVPYRDISDHALLTKGFKPVPLARVQSYAGSVTNSADRPLNLVFRPRPEDGFCYQFNSIDQYFGLLIIAYSEEIRSSYHEFGADDFAPNITMSGTVKLRQPTLTGEPKGYVDSTFSYPDRPPCCIFSQKDGTWTWFSRKDFVCAKKNDGSCQVTGLPYVYNSILDLKDLEI